MTFLAGLAEEGDALELAVRTGPIALALTRAGIRVDGAEQSRHMVDRLREKSGGQEIDVLLGDLATVSTGQRSRLVYLVYNTIGNLLTQDAQIACFENASRHLDQEGVFVLEWRVPSARPGLQFVDAEGVTADAVTLGIATVYRGQLASREHL